METYYHSLSAGDLETARACLSDEMKAAAEMPDSDLNNLKSLTNLTVSPAYPIKLHGQNDEEVQVTADYYATYKKVFAEMDGRQHRFIYVAKATADSAWRIISIGTGP